METKIPQTKNEAFAQLDAMLSDKEKSELAKGDAIAYHFTLGMWIRNNWIYQQREEDVKRLAKAFRTEMLFFEADSLSGKIIEYYQRTGTKKGRTLVMSGEIETEKVPRKCPKCGGDMKETGAVIMID